MYPAGRRAASPADTNPPSKQSGGPQNMSDMADDGATRCVSL